MAIIRVGDDLIDDETGEYAGPADNDLRDSIETEDDLLWYMRRRSQYQFALEAKQKEYDAILANCQKLLKDQQARLDWLNKRYESDASALARTLLPRKANGELRTKTYQCPWGKWSYRETQNRVVIWENDKAMEWCRKNAPEAIVTKSTVHVSLLPDWVMSKLVGDDADGIEGFSVVEGGESARFTAS